MEAQSGWYQDPWDQAKLRYWDGATWTEHVQTPQAQWPPGNRLQPSVPSRPYADPSPVPPIPKQHSGLFGGKKALEDENAALRQMLAEIGVAERDRLADEVAALSASAESERAKIAEAQSQSKASLIAQQQQLVVLQDQIVQTEDTLLLQEVGLYVYRHPLDDAVAYKAQLAQLSTMIKDAVKSKTAVSSVSHWTVNGSQKEGTKMVNDTSKLMLRAYNNEADNLIRTMRPYTLDSAIARLGKARDTIARLGKIMQLRVTDFYHGLRVRELELTADYLAKTAEEKEAQRAERARLREEEKAQREYKREQERLAKELSHYESALAALAGSDADPAEKAKIAAEIEELRNSMEGIQQRQANTRAGYVYVISNYGSFGNSVVKIGLTRRLDPLDRVRELGDASVPFHYDVHAVVFSDDAVGLETELHRRFANRRVNMVNLRREFFHVTPQQVKEALVSLSGSLLTYTDEPEAEEWRRSEGMRSGTAAGLE